MDEFCYVCYAMHSVVRITECYTVYRWLSNSHQYRRHRAKTPVIGAAAAIDTGRIFEFVRACCEMRLLLVLYNLALYGGHAIQSHEPIADAALRRDKPTQTTLDDVFVYNGNVDYMEYSYSCECGGCICCARNTMKCLHKYVPI